MPVIDLNCPGCGGPVGVGQKECNYCHRPIYISMFNSVFNMKMPELKKELDENPNSQKANFSIAMCYWNLKLYDKALPAFEKAIEDNFDNSESFFYAAVSLLKGKKAFLALRSDIDKIIEYLNAAIMIEPRGIYHYFLAYIKYDFFERKSFNVKPDWQETLQIAIRTGVSQADVVQFFEMLQVEMPECLRV